MGEFDVELYAGKTLSSVFKDIVKNSEDKRNQMDVLITDMRKLIKTVSDVQIVMPMVKEYMDVGVKNDEQLIKLAAVVQRILSKDTSTGDGSSAMLSDEEKAQLLKQINEMNEPVFKPEKAKKDEDV